MDSRTRLFKIVTLLVRNLSLKSDKLNINGALTELFARVNETLNTSDKVAISETEKNIRGSLARMAGVLIDWDRRDESLPSIEFVLNDMESAMRSDLDYYETVESAINTIYNAKDDIPGRQRMVQTELALLSQDIRGSEVSLKLFKMSNNLTNMVSRGENIGATLTDFLHDLEDESRHLIGDGREDLISYMDSDDPESVKSIVHEMFEKEDGGAILRFGWQKLNKGLQKGIRLGNFMGISALQHNNKTGTTLNMFRHLAVYNKPVIRKEGKVPTLIRWSFEDDLTDNYQYLFKDTLHDQGKEYTGIEGLKPDYIASTVMDELTQHGWKILLIKANPSEWNYMKMQAFVNGLINEGMDPQLFMCDYLLKMPTVGCDRHGPMGTDYRDLVRRTRNYFNKIGCAFITPFQLNTTAKNMLVEGVRAPDLLPTIAGGGFTANSKQIDQELDISLLIHVVKNGEEYHQHFVIDKHRLPTYIDEGLKRFYLPMPEGFMPLRSDIDKEETGTRKLRSAQEESMEF